MLQNPFNKLQAVKFKNEVDSIQAVCRSVTEHYFTNKYLIWKQKIWHG